MRAEHTVPEGRGRAPMAPARRWNKFTVRYEATVLIAALHEWL